jgi:hypothetical protein
MNTGELIRVVLAEAIGDASIYYSTLPASDPADIHGRLPAIVLSEVGYSEGPVSRDGYGGWDRPRWQLDCWDEAYLGARELAEQVQAAMRASDLGARLSGRIDTTDADTKLYRVVLDYQLWAPLENPESPES